MRAQGSASLGRQGGPLAHAKSMLLVGDDQSQFLKGDTFGEECVGADDEIVFPSL